VSTPADPALARAAELARDLLGGAIGTVAPVAGGRNSRVYRVEAAGRVFALKQYPSCAVDPRDRLGTEAAALALMERHAVAGVPRLIALDAERGFALLSWLDGVPVARPTPGDIDAAAAFLAAMHALRTSGGFPPEHLASEACLSGAEIIRQIRVRLDRLREVADGDLRDFLAGRFAAGLAAALDRTAILGKTHDIDFTMQLPHEKRSLVPSDFGFHNSVRMSDQSLAFFDFEYFGWDDPVKMTADVMLHPGTMLAPDLRRRFRLAAEQIYGEDAAFRPRLVAYYPLIGLRWVLILLNDFLPERRARHGAENVAERAVREARQLAKARELLVRLGRAHDLG
jgi:hypothetical protein